MRYFLGLQGWLAARIRRRSWRSCGPRLGSRAAPGSTLAHGSAGSARFAVGSAGGGQRGDARRAACPLPTPSPRCAGRGRATGSGRARRERTRGERWSGHALSMRSSGGMEEGRREPLSLRSSCTCRRRGSSDRARWRFLVGLPAPPRKTGAAALNRRNFGNQLPPSLRLALRSFALAYNADGESGRNIASRLAHACHLGSGCVACRGSFRSLSAPFVSP